MKSRTIAFISVFAGILLFGVSMVLIGSVLPLLKLRLGLSDIIAGGLFSILPFGLLIGSISFGPITDKYGYRWVLSIACLFLAIGFIGIGHTFSLLLLRISILFFGIGGGVINGATSALISDLSNDNKKIANLNLLGVFFGIGAFCMPLILSTLNDELYVLAINIAAMLSVLISLLFFLIKYPLSLKKEKISFKLIPLFLKKKVFLIICFFLFFQSAFEAIINNWSVSYFTEQLRVPQRDALIALSFSVLGMTLMRILTGGVFRNVKSKTLLQISFSLFIAGIICLFIPSSFIYINTFGLFLIGAGLSPGFPVMLGLTGNMFKEISGTAFSFVMFIALTGNIIINYITGILIEQLGIKVFVYVILIQVLTMITLYLLIKKEDKGLLDN
ncbi:MAG TPA: MFS transporter [Dysgonamonadaceae bacterium]|nr:MFS transporter [Dysgonamonadaceae bacterium]